MCQCPAGMHLVRGECQSATASQACPGGAVWRDEQCQCPAGTAWDPTTSQCSEAAAASQCPGGALIKDGQCKCPDGQEWNHQVNRCVERSVACEGGKVKDANGECQCPEGQDWSTQVSRCVERSVACEGGKVKDANGECQCPEGTTWSAAQNLCAKEEEEQHAQCTPQAVQRGSSSSGVRSGTAWLSNYKCNGPDISRVSLRYSWHTNVEEPGYRHQVSWTIGDHMTIQEKYCQIPSELKGRITINRVTFQADVHSRGARVGSTSVKLWIQVAAGSSREIGGVGNWRDLIQGMSTEEAKQIFKDGFELRNLSISEITYIGLPSSCPGTK